MGKDVNWWPRKVFNKIPDWGLVVLALIILVPAYAAIGWIIWNVGRGIFMIAQAFCQLIGLR